MCTRWMTIALALSACVTQAGRAQIVNGSFDDGLEGWTVDTTENWRTGVRVVGGNPTDHFQMRSRGVGAGCLEQAFHCGPTGPATTCLLQLDYTFRPRDATPGGGLVRIELDGEVLAEIETEFDYEPSPFETASFAVPGGTHELRICHESLWGHWLMTVDNVSATSPCPADLTGDQVVSSSDMMAVMANWGACADPCPASCAGDLNGDCRVDVDDLVGVITAWGGCAAGACCLPDACVQLPWQDCLAAGGAYRGTGVACEDAACVVDPCDFATLCPVEAGTVTAPDAQPREILAVDVDGDDILDLVYTESHSDTINVHPGHGDGTFGDGTSYSPGPYFVGRIAAGDLDGDGAPELATEYQGDVLVYRNDGSGVFDEVDTYAGLQTVRAVRIGDMNGDGLPDIVTASTVAAGVSWLSVFINEGDAVFDGPILNSIDLDTRSMALGDLDGDGDLDAAIVAALPHSEYPLERLAVLWNAGDGSIEATTMLDLPEIERVSLGDLDGDGRLDILTAGGTTGVTVVLNEGDRVFTVDASYDTGGAEQANAIGAALADMDGDDDLDVLVNASSPAREIWFLLNDGNGGLTADTLADVGSGNGYPYWLAAADFDGDGRPDVATTRYNGGDAIILLNPEP